MTLPIAQSRLGLHVGNGKYLFAVAIEKGWARIPEVLYFGADKIEDVRAHMINVASTLPPGSKVVGVAPAIGFWHDEDGSRLVA